MRERPILFSGEMVRAILAGDKRVTRRVVKPRPKYLGGIAPKVMIHPADHSAEFYGRDNFCVQVTKCPYGAPGDRLWVRETWYPSDDLNDVWGDHRDWPECEQNWRNIEYRADGSRMPFRWRPSIHMPRWASRLTLTVKNVRVERLNEITPDDAIAEGVTKWAMAEDDRRMFDEDGRRRDKPLGPRVLDGRARNVPYLVNGFAELWDSINADRGYDWASNPWVWVVEFEREIERGGAR